MTSPTARLAQRLAEALLAGSWDIAGMSERIRLVMTAKRPSRWHDQLAKRVHDACANVTPRPTRHRLAEFIQLECRLPRRVRVPEHGDGPLRNTSLLSLPAPAMFPAAAIATRVVLPTITTPGQLADWLAVSPSELDWFADPAGLLARWDVADRGTLRHYRTQLLPKPRGRWRLVESPKPRLKEIQRRILAGLLNLVPVHPAAHAFVAGRSIVTGVAPHCGRDVVLSIDLREFFPSVHAGRIHATFRTLGYPDRVASLLTGLCTTQTPTDRLAQGEFSAAQRQLYQSRHLPQGAPTSPALANLAAWRLDCRLEGLAQRFGAVYTRYADDLIFSGDSSVHRALPRLRVWATAIILDEGFAIQRRKTRVMPRGQRQTVGGLVLNRTPNVPRCEYETLRAILHNCIRSGPESQNRDGHPRFRESLRGRIAWVAASNPERGSRLLSEFERVSWGD